MTVFALLGTSNDSLSNVTATAPLTAIKVSNKQNISNNNTNSSSCTNPQNLDIGYHPVNSSCVTSSSSSSTPSPNTSAATIKMEQQSQLGLAVGKKDAISVMSPLTCGEISHRHRTYSSNSTTGHHTRALGMILFLVVVFTSTSSVLCVPLEQPELTGSFLSSKQQQSPYDLESKGQLYLPSIVNPSQEQRNDPSIYKPRLQIQENEDESIRSDNEWETVIDPHLYILTEWNSNPILQQQRTRRDAGPSLSIVNPLDVLRQRLLLEIARRRMRQSHRQIMDNAEILKQIGRRK